MLRLVRPMEGGREERDSSVMDGGREERDASLQYALQCANIWKHGVFQILQPLVERRRVHTYPRSVHALRHPMFQTKRERWKERSREDAVAASDKKTEKERNERWREGCREDAVSASETRERCLRARGGHGAAEDADARSSRQVTGMYPSSYACILLLLIRGRSRASTRRSGAR